MFNFHVSLCIAMQCKKNAFSDLSKRCFSIRQSPQFLYMFHRYRTLFIPILFNANTYFNIL